MNTTKRETRIYVFNYLNKWLLNIRIIINIVMFYVQRLMVFLKDSQRRCVMVFEVNLVILINCSIKNYVQKY